MTAKEALQVHRRLNHASWNRLVAMGKAGSCIGVPDFRNMSSTESAKAERMIKECNACAQAKMHRKALGHRGLDKGTRAGEVIHMDTFHASSRVIQRLVRRRQSIVSLPLMHSVSGDGASREVV